MKPSTDRKASPARGQAWRRRGSDNINFYIMAVADGYVMARYKGCSPFVMFVKDLHRSCVRMEAFDRDLGRPS